jgi:hypothetical protein
MAFSFIQFFSGLFRVCGYADAEAEVQIQQLTALEEAEALRRKASMHAEKRGKLFQSSQEAFRNNHKKEAKELSDDAKKEGFLMYE